ncbi:MAG: aminomethyl-transferring glycine dehydrogenase subunit GcvPB [Alphaproteobacteria bacterium]|nr:aminomethyl-transferring glycine dehydrogenase subunit GcvPB [Alphaproteobacteria bacterium]
MDTTTLQDEPLLFEKDRPGLSGVDLPEPSPLLEDRLGGLRRRGPVGLPGLSEPDVIRHYTRLSQKNYGIDTGFYPLGSCTMKHNPRLGEAMARLPGFAEIHPFQPVGSVQGALELMNTLAEWLKTLTGLPAVALSPAAGAHGEWCGIMTIRAALEKQGDPRRRVLVPDSAHGTNPATAARCGYAVESVPGNDQGRVSLASLKARLGGDVAALMLTNPNTCGLFEDEILEIAAAVHAVGAYFYLDGANFNALVGRVRVADLGVDAMHINLHKTFATPHGGGGPGAGPTVLSQALAPFAPLPFVVSGAKGFTLVESTHRSPDESVPSGRLKGFHGQFGVFVRALAYMMSMGGDGLRQASGDAVLNANYLLASLKDDLSAPFAGPCMHEVLFDDSFLKGTGVTTLDMAKAMIDEGYHPMTVYFPLVVHGAMLIEPTETESKDTLDRFIATMKTLAARAKAGDSESFRLAPRHAPRRRLDETRAARTPVLRWKSPVAT